MQAVDGVRRSPPDCWHPFPCGRPEVGAGLSVLRRSRFVNHALFVRDAHCGQTGRCRFHVCRTPRLLPRAVSTSSWPARVDQSRAGMLRSGPHARGAVGIQERDPQARTRLLEAISSDPDPAPGTSARLYNNLGVCQWRLGDLGSAAKALAQAVAHGPVEPTPYHNIARLAIQQRNLPAAREVMAACMERFPQDEESRVALARILFGSGYREQALDEAERLMDGTQASPIVFATYGMLLEESGDRRAEALAALRRGLALFPRHPTLVNNLAYVLLQGDDAIAARDVLETLADGGAHGRTDASIVLPATWGLLHLHEGDLHAGIQGYQRAKRRARKLGRWE